MLRIFKGISLLLAFGILFFVACSSGGSSSSGGGSSIGKTYEVYGGNDSITGTQGYNPQSYGYTLLGTDTSTQTFSGSYKYYVIVTRPVNIAYIDTVKGSDGAYYGTNTTGNTNTHSNVGGSPDGKTAGVGDLYNGASGGYIIIDASGKSLTSITVYVG